MTIPSLDSKAAAAQKADALRLISLVRRRRRLRRTAALSLLALPAWIAAVVTTQAVTPDGSWLWEAAGDWATPGLVALAVLFLLALVGLLVTGISRRPEGRAAAHLARRLAPLFGRRADSLGRVRDLRITGDQNAAAALTAVVDRRPKIGYGLLVWFVGSLLLALAVGWQVGPVWQANHGEGSATYTYGVDAFLDHTEQGRSGTDYYLDTPEGVVIDQSGHPKAGQRFVVTSSGAYAVGGHTWLLVGAIAATGAASAIVTLLLIVGEWSRETVRRAALPHPDAAAALDAARAAAHTGQPLELRIGEEPPVWLLFDRLHDLPARQVLTRHRRRVVLGTASVLVLAGGAAALTATGVFSPPPKDGEVHVAALADVVPGGTVHVYWSGPDVYPGLFTDLVGTKPAGQWDVDLPDLPSAGPRSFASVSVFRLPAGLPAATAMQRWARFLTTDDEGTPIPGMTGLPSGWTGILRGKPDDRVAEAVTAQGSWLLDVTVQGETPDEAAELGETATSDDQLDEGLRTVAAAIAADGIDRFAEQTSR